MIHSGNDLVSTKGSTKDTTARSAGIYEFLIAGIPYRLKTNHDDATVQELVAFINKKMEESLALTKHGSYQNAAVLTALNLAEELILLKRKAHRELEKIEERVLKLSVDIENSKK
jgi:cell division protein ZapA